MGTMESGDEGMQGNEERIYVSVRLRPLNDKEISRNDVSDWECSSGNTIVYKDWSIPVSERSMYPTVYAFDRVFRTDCSTREVYEQGAKDVAVSVVSGINSSVFAYGQTSSGKTFTMTGITEYAIADIYKYIQEHPEREFLLKFSAMEIYNESVRDLLNADSHSLRLLDDPERGTVVEKLSDEILVDWNHVIQLLSICEAQRQNGETSLNEMSSRSHQIIRLTVESTSRDFLSKGSSSTLTATVNFVDLAGSERASQSLSAGTRLKEGCHINRSLLTLGTVIRKLSKGRNEHIPYRDSKLTRILQASLGGNSRTAIICTMSPARSQVEQSRNTLLFASCAKEVTTNAKVNVVMSDKALIKHLQMEVARLESQLRSSHSTFASSNYSALLTEKGLQIMKLEKEVKELILQRDSARSQVQDLLRILGENEPSLMQVGTGYYPHLRVQKSLEDEIPEQETSILADPQSVDVDTRTCSDELSSVSSEDHFAKIPYYDGNFSPVNAPPRILMSSSNLSESDSCQDFGDVEKRSNETSENLFKEVRCRETDGSSNVGSMESTRINFAENRGFPTVKVYVNVDNQEPKSASPPSMNDNGFMSSELWYNNDTDLKKGAESIPSKENRGFMFSVSLKEGKEPMLPMFKKEQEVSLNHFLGMPSLEKLSLTHDLAGNSSGVSSLKLTRSRSCNSITMDSASLWFKNACSCENTTSMGLGGETESFERKIASISYNSNVESTKYFRHSAEPVLDIEIDTSNRELPMSEDVVRYSCGKNKESELPNELDTTNPGDKEIEPEAIQSSKKDLKDIGLDPIEEECRSLTSWPTEFKRLQREIIELWHACNVSLVHRTYFFLLFQGDPLDAIYMEVEMRRMKFLNEKFSKGEKTVVNGRCLTLASSAKDLGQERRKLIKQMEKKFSEQERESLFLKWGIGLNTKLRKLQLAHLLWSNNEDINHIYDSAYLVAKLVGLIESEQAPKEMFGVNFTPRRSTKTYNFKRSLVSLL